MRDWHVCVNETAVHGVHGAREQQETQGGFTVLCSRLSVEAALCSHWCWLRAPTRTPRGGGAVEGMHVACNWGCFRLRGHEQGSTALYIAGQEGHLAVAEALQRA